MNSELQWVLWDFGNTLAKEALSHASRGLPDWPDAFKAVHALYGDAWDSGTLSDEEFAKLMAERLAACRTRKRPLSVDESTIERLQGDSVEKRLERL